MLPAFVFAFTILLVRMHLFSMPLSDVYWTSALDTTTLSDVFNYWKAIAILAAGCLAVLVVIVAYFKDQFHFKKSFLYIPTLIYAGFVLLSLLFSRYPYFALRGMQEHFEGSLVLFAYILMIIFLVNASDSERRVRMVVFCAICAAVLLGILGITQATGHDFFATATGQKVMTPNYTLETGIKSWDMIDILAAIGEQAYKFAFTKGEVYQTVYNINYVPFYLIVLIPVSAILFIFYSTRENKKQMAASIIFLVIYGLLLYNFFAANSASGYFGLLAGTIVALIVFAKHIRKWLKPIICLLVVLGLVMSVLAERWLPEIKGVVGAVARNITLMAYADDAPQVQMDFENPAGETEIPIDYIETGDKQMKFGINGDAIVLTRDDSQSSYVITDNEGEQLYLTSVSDNSSEFQVLDERFHDYLTLAVNRDEEFTYIVISTFEHKWYFRYDGQSFQYLNDVQKLTPMSVVPKSNLLSEDFGSYRGRIWNTTLPMLKKYLLLGSGADTFTFVYPQNDYAALYNMHPLGRNMTLVTDKAHNLYMQYWVNTGLISLLAWLVLVGYYLVGAVKYFRKRGFVDFCDFVNGGIFCGIIGFLAVAFFNDGSVNTMPMFYTMLGTGLAINMRDRWPVESEVVEADEAGVVEKKMKKGKKGKNEAAMPEM